MAAFYLMFAFPGARLGAGGTGCAALAAAACVDARHLAGSIARRAGRAVAAIGAAVLIAGLATFVGAEKQPGAPLQAGQVVDGSRPRHPGPFGCRTLHRSKTIMCTKSSVNRSPADTGTDTHTGCALLNPQ